MTHRDLMEGNADLIECAARLLVGKASYAIAANITHSDEDALQLEVETRNITRLDVFLDDRPQASHDITAPLTTVRIPARMGYTRRPKKLQLQGFADGHLVVRCRRPLPV